MAEEINYPEIVQKNLLTRYGIQKSLEDINGHIEHLMGTYKIEGRRSVQAVTQLYAEHEGIDFYPSVLDARYMPLNKWLSLEVTVDKDFNTDSDKVLQRGRIGDHCGTINFMISGNANVEKMEVGKSYLLKNVVTNEYNGKKQVIINSNSEIIALDKQIPVRQFQKTEAQ